MNPTNRWRILLTTLILSFLGLAGFIFLFSTAPRSAAQPTAFSFADQNNVPINGQVRVLCFRSEADANPFADVIVQVAGGVPAAPLPADCLYLAALRLRHTQPSAKHSESAYEIYTTSWQPGTSAPLPASGVIMLNDAWPLTLFNVVVSLGWEPTPNSNVTTVDQVQESLYQTAQALYDWTEGQMAFGAVSIYTGGENWSEADIRLLPANDKRPSVFVGGIVPDKLTYTGFFTDTTYTPAMIYLGRLWDGRDAFQAGNGRWDTPNAYRTIAHEWVHYALFMYDEYQDTTGLSGNCICQDLSGTGCGFGDRDGSVMAYHYEASEFWHKDTHLTVSNFCYDTWQFHVHGMTDWSALMQWSTIQELDLLFMPLQSPTPSLNAGPTLGLARHLIGQEAGEQVYLPLVTGGSGSVVTTKEPWLNLFLETAVSPPHTLPSQVYLFKGEPYAPDRILPQGRLTGDPSGDMLGSIQLLDVTSGDTVRTYVEWPNAADSGGMRYTNNGEIDSDVLATENFWDFTLAHYFALEENEVVSLTLTLEDRDGRLAAPTIQLCSLDANIGCHPDWKQSMTEMGSQWQTTFKPLDGQPELPRYLVVRIWDAGETAVQNEIVQWLQVAGGVGPTHNDGMAPLLDDVVMVNARQPYPDTGDCNVVSFMPAANANALMAPLPNMVNGLIGIPLDIQITLTQDQCPPEKLGQNSFLPIEVLINFGYSQDEVDRLSLNETTDLVILHYQPGGGWAEWQQVDINTDLNWLTTITNEDGIYAVGWR